MPCGESIKKEDGQNNNNNSNTESKRLATHPGRDESDLQQEGRAETEMSEQIWERDRDGGLDGDKGKIKEGQPGFPLDCTDMRKAWREGSRDRLPTDRKT